MINEIKGFEGLYGVDEYGNVYSLRNNRILSQYNNTIEYKKVDLYKDGKKYKKYVHRLVAEAFIPNPNNYTDVNHIDCNRANNTKDNLEWVSHSTNMKYVWRVGARSKRGEK